MHRTPCVQAVKYKSALGTSQNSSRTPPGVLRTSLDFNRTTRQILSTSADLFGQGISPGRTGVGPGHRRIYSGRRERIQDAMVLFRTPRFYSGRCGFYSGRYGFTHDGPFFSRRHIFRQGGTVFIKDMMLIRAAYLYYHLSAPKSQTTKRQAGVRV